MRARVAAPHALEALLSTPPAALGQHYAFVRQCLAPPPARAELRAAAEASLARVSLGRSPLGATLRADARAEAEDAAEAAGLPPPPRQFYPVRYLLALVRRCVVAQRAPEHAKRAAPEHAKRNPTMPPPPPPTDPPPPRRT